MIARHINIISVYVKEKEKEYKVYKKYMQLLFLIKPKKKTKNMASALPPDDQDVEKAMCVFPNNWTWHFR